VAGFEVSGTVEALGPGVAGPPGPSVLALTRFGGQATQALADARTVFPLAEGAAAHAFLQERRNVGKVLFACT
jgi:NADPH:quinone reductase-like Zn-dependent oxidoreductase